MNFGVDDSQSFSEERRKQIPLRETYEPSPYLLCLSTTSGLPGRLETDLFVETISNARYFMDAMVSRS